MSNPIGFGPRGPTARLARSATFRYRQPLRVQDVVAVADVLDLGQQLVDVVMHREVPAGQRIGLTRGDPGDEIDRGIRVGAPAFGQLALHPLGDVQLVGAGGRRPLGDLLGHPDRQQPGMHAEPVTPKRLASCEVLGELGDGGLRHGVGGHQRPPERPAWLVMLRIRPRRRVIISGSTSWLW
jgi:hypothetical protein